jgi:hypothetical protein
MSEQFEAILDESISALEAGVPVPEILAETPDYATELRPLLYMALVLTEPHPDLAPAERKAALKAEYLRQAAALPAITPSSLPEKASAVYRIIKRRLTPQALLNDLLTMGITALLTLLMAALTLNYLAADTLPGDWLYGIKRLSEQTQLLVTFSNADKVELLTEFNRRRLTEIEQLIQQKRAAVVEFEGLLESRGQNLWIVEGHTIILPDDALVEGNPAEGSRVKVIGLLRTNGALVADTIQLRAE